jgi:hypothetical protein
MHGRQFVDLVDRPWREAGMRAEALDERWNGALGVSRRGPRFTSTVVQW